VEESTPEVKKHFSNLEMEVKFTTTSGNEVTVGSWQGFKGYSSDWQPALQGHLTPEQFKGIIQRLNKARLNHRYTFVSNLLVSVSALMGAVIGCLAAVGIWIGASICIVLVIAAIVATVLLDPKVREAQREVLDRETSMLSSEYASKKISFRNAHTASGVFKGDTLIITLPQ